MPTLFETDALVVTLASTHPLGGTRDLAISDGERTPLASARETTSGLSRLARAVQGGQSGRYAWTVRDPSDHRLLEVVKPKRGLRGPRAEVSLADGTLLGTAEPTKGLTPLTPASLQGPDGTVLGELAPALGERRAHPVLMYRVRDEDGAEVGEIAQDIQGDWGFHLSFTAGADLAVRALTIAWTLGLAQERTTVGI